MIRCRYWRLLSYEPKTAKKVILTSKASMKPVYEQVMDDDLLYVMLEQLGSVASVYYKPAEDFITPKRGPPPVSTDSPLPDDDNLQINVDKEEDGDDDDDDDDDDSEFDMDIFADSDWCVCLKKKEEGKNRSDFWNFLRVYSFFVLVVMAKHHPDLIMCRKLPGTGRT